jgi:hypothetical protein
MREEEVEVDVDAVILATGFRLFPADAKPEYGYGKYKNVITGMEMDRLLAPTRPFNAVVRPGDGKVPDSIGYVLCTGSRDAQVGNPLCSRICCMYSIKHNQLIMGALPLADVSVHYMDVRAAGKGYDEFYQQAKDMGAQFIKGRVAKITEKDNGDLVLRYEDTEGTGEIVRRLGFNKPAAGKTGTTNGYKDAWFTGFTPAVCGSVCVGFVRVQGLKDSHGGGITGGRGAAPIWTRFMARATDGEPPRPFLQPAGIRFQTVDPRTGEPVLDESQAAESVALKEGE